MGQSDLPQYKVEAYQKIALGELPEEKTESNPSQAFPRIHSPINSPMRKIKKSKASISGCCGNKSSTKKSVVVKPRREKRTGPGAELKKIFEERGVPPCEDCDSLAEKMDQWGVDKCRLEIDSLVNEILPRARSWFRENHSFVSKFLPGIVETSGIRLVLKKYINEAIERARIVVKWQYGITTHPSRLDNHFPETIESLKQAGFDSPWIFLDGPIPSTLPQELRQRISSRSSSLGVIGNYMTALWELYVRNPLADRYAIFQDDIVLCKNVKPYLDSLQLPEDRYWNLFTFMENEKLIKTKKGFIESSQYGRGAVALVYPRSAVVETLSSRSLVMKPQAANKKIATKRIDGGICTAICKKHGQAQTHTEYVHAPSLVQHQGLKSTLGNDNQPQSNSFPGEDFDCLTLLERKETKDGKQEETTSPLAGQN